MVDRATRNQGPSGAASGSWYEATATPRAPAAPLRGEIEVDACVVGAGLTGLSAALHLAEAGRRVAVVEARRVGAGASGRNGGQLCTGLRLDQDALEAKLGAADARRLWALAEAAKALIHDLARRHAIAYDYRPGLLHVAHRRRYVEGYRRYAAWLQQAYAYAALRFVDRDELEGLLAAPGYFGGTLDEGAGHLHPLEFVHGLARAACTAGATLFESTPALDFVVERPSRVRLHTAAGSIRAEHLVLATNGHLDRLAPEASAFVMPINSFVVTTVSLGPERAAALIPSNAAVADSRFAVNYFRRTSDHRLLFGGGETSGCGVPADIPAFVRPRLEGVFPQLRDVALEHGWGGAVAITRSRLPHLGRLAPTVWSAGGYSGQGVALATLAGKLLADAVAGAGDGFDTFALIPQQRFPGGRLARAPLLVLAMTWFALRDRL